MNINDEDLFDNERLIQTKNANAIIKVDEYGLSQFAFDQLMWTVGMEGHEAIGGRIHLTNYRLIFKSHALNRVKGKFSIFLPTVKDMKDESGFISKKIAVSTPMQHFDFVIWGVPEFISKINAAKNALSPTQTKYIRNTALKEHKKCGEGLQIFSAMETVNVGILKASKIAEMLELAKNPMDVSSILGILELFHDEFSDE